MVRNGKYFQKVLIVVGLLVFCGGDPCFGQTKKRLKELEKKERQREKGQREAETELGKRHKRMQSKATRKRMRRNQRKSNRLNRNKRTFFLKRWFTK